MERAQPWVILHPALGPRWLPESSRWLLLHGKTQLAMQNLRKVATMNGRREEGERLSQEVGGWLGGRGVFCWQLRGVLGCSSLPGLTHRHGGETVGINRVGKLRCDHWMAV